MTLGEVFWLSHPHFSPTQQNWGQIRVFMVGGSPGTYEAGLWAFTSRKQGCLKDPCTRGMCCHKKYIQSLP